VAALDGGYRLVPRGTIEGKGPMRTWFLRRADDPG
jgi:hypothetical protein